MIEKRIKYQEGGVHDPLEAIIFLMGKRASPGGLSSAEEKELNRLMEETGFMSQKKAQGGRIKLAKKPKTKPPVMTLLELEDWLNEIDPNWWEEEHEPGPWDEEVLMRVPRSKAQGIQTILNLHKRSA